MPKGWTRSLHAAGHNGDHYFNSQDKITVVTTENIHDPKTLTIITSTANNLKARLSVVLAQSKRGALEIYVGINDVGSEKPVVRYYIVDHQQSTMLLVGATPTAQFSVSSAHFDTHKNCILECQYWKHLLRFPGHVQLDLSVRDKLSLRLIRKSSCNQIKLTSFFDVYLPLVKNFENKGPGLPFYMDECLYYIERLKAYQENPALGNMLIANLNKQICEHRFVTQDDPNGQVLPFVSRLLCLAFFNAPLIYLKEMQDGYNIFRRNEKGYYFCCASIIVLLSATISSVIFYQDKYPSAALWRVQQMLAISLGMCICCLLTVVLMALLRAVSYESEKKERIIYHPNGFSARRPTHHTFIILAIFVSMPRVLYYLTMVTFGVALVSLTAMLSPYYTIVISGALFLVFLTFVADDRVHPLTRSESSIVIEAPHSTNDILELYLGAGRI